MNKPWQSIVQPVESVDREGRTASKSDQSPLKLRLLTISCTQISCKARIFLYFCVTINFRGMRYLRSTFYAKKGQAVKVNFDQPSKIMLMSDRDFKKYRDNSGTITYWGGYHTESPVTFAIPSAGTWHVIVELGWNDQKKVQASVDLLDELPESMRRISAPEDEERAEEAPSEQETQEAEETNA
jgi:hypothetical protein